MIFLLTILTARIYKQILTIKIIIPIITIIIIMILIIIIKIIIEVVVNTVKECSIHICVKRCIQSGY